MYVCGSRWGLAFEASKDPGKTSKCYLVSRQDGSSDPNVNNFVVALGFEDLSEALAWFSARKAEVLYSYGDGRGAYLSDKVGSIMDKLLRKLEWDIGKDGLTEVLLKASDHYERQGTPL